MRSCLVLVVVLVLSALPVAAQEGVPVLVATLNVASRDVAWTPDGTFLVITDTRAGISFYAPPVFAAPARSLPGTELAWTLAVAPDQTLVAYGDARGEIILVDVETGVARPLSGHNASVNDVVFSPDGRLLVTSGEDDVTRVWDLDSGAQRVLDAHSDATWSASFTESGQVLLTTGADETVRLWNPGSGALLGELEGHSGMFDEVRASALLPGTTLFLTGSTDDTVRFWDARNGGAGRVLETGSDGVLSLAIHPGGDMLAIGTEDSNVLVWSLDDDTILATLEGHDGDVNNVAFSPDGRYLASVADDGVRVWAFAD